MEFEANATINDEVNGLWMADEGLEAEESLYYPLTGLIRCPLKVYFQKSGVEITDPPSLASKIIMGYGTELHGVVYKRLDILGWWHSRGEERKHYSAFHNLVYVPDKFLIIDVEPYIAEVKSISPYLYNGTRYIPSIKDTPREDDYMQLQVEMELLGLPGMLIYLNRDNGQMHMIPLMRDPVPLQTIGNLSTQLSNALQEQREVPRPEGYSLIIDKDSLPRDKQQRDKVQYKSTWQCYTGNGWCPYLSHCWKEEGLDPQWREIKEEGK